MSIENAASSALQFLLGMPGAPKVRSWAVSGFDRNTSELVLSLPGRLIEDNPRLVFRTDDGEELVSVRYKAGFLLHEDGPPVDTVFVELGGARTDMDVALGTALLLAFADLLGTVILDPEGCYRGPRVETADAFRTRLRPTASFSDYLGAVQDLRQRIDGKT